MRAWCGAAADPFYLDLHHLAHILEGLQNEQPIDNGEWAPAQAASTFERSSPPAADVWDDLSPQEVQIATMASRGLTNREIGERLFLSHRTVGSHLYRMFPKLGISSRTELLRMAAGRERA